MTSLLALFVRSLREDARGSPAYVLRGGMGGFIIIVLLPSFFNVNWANAPGRAFFTEIIAFQIVAIALFGVGYFAAAVSEEKEGQMLGLLRMTGLNPLSILLGKSTSRLCSALLLLVGQFPFTIFAVTMGGVSLRQVIAAYCTVGAFVFLLCNLALVGSVFARHQLGAAAFTFSATLLLLALAPLLGTVPHRWKTALHIDPRVFSRVHDALWNATPIARLQEVLGTGFAGRVTGWQVASNLGLGLGCFLLAWAAFGRLSERTLEGSARNESARRSLFGIRLSRPPRPWKNALFWKDFYFLCGGSAALAWRTAAYLGALAVLHYTPEGDLMYLGLSRGAITWIVPGLFAIDVALLASRIFGVELRNHTMPLGLGLACMIYFMSWIYCKILFTPLVESNRFFVPGASFAVLLILILIVWVDCDCMRRLEKVGAEN